jgi:ABC-type branched-subunit amino acid transport system substrate-binding protein
LSGIIGSPNNLAVRDTLNEECIPQLANMTGLPAWGTDAEEYPWTTGQMIPYDIESRVYMQALKDQGVTTVGLFYVSTDFGLSYADTVKAEAADFGLEVVAEETVEPADGAPPVGQLTTIAAAAPEAIIAVPLGAGCVTFLGALAEKKAQTPGWTPLTYVTNTCASSLILRLAGANADGMYTSNQLIDVTDPANAADPDVQAYLEFMADLGKSDLVTTATAGWTAAEVTVAIIKQAMESPEGLTRASIINAARNFNYEPTLGRPGVVYKTNGLDDGFPAESLQVLQYDADSATFTEIGDVVTAFESS